MSDESAHKASHYQLKPTPEQERMMAETAWRCRTLYNTALQHRSTTPPYNTALQHRPTTPPYNTALEQRITAYRRCGVTLTCAQQHAELPGLKATFPT